MFKNLNLQINVDWRNWALPLAILHIPIFELLSVRIGPVEFKICYEAFGEEDDV